MTSALLIRAGSNNQLRGGADETIKKSKEYEARFLSIDVINLRAQIKEAGGILIHENKKLRRYVYSLTHAKGYARVRDDGVSTTMTVKIYKEGEKYAQEYEVSIHEDIDAAKNFIENLGFQQKAYHETMREKWCLGDCHEIAIDTIPGIPAYVEIECDTEEHVKDMSKRLGFNFEKDARFGAYALVYEELYGIPADVINEQIPILTFDTVREQLVSRVKKNKELFDDTVNKQKTL